VITTTVASVPVNLRDTGMVSTHGMAARVSCLIWAPSWELVPTRLQWRVIAVALHALQRCCQDGAVPIQPRTA
jgi:hypothetical protein